MALITFLSDFGSTDHYVAAVKAKILSINSGLQIVDISHDIEPCNLAQASFVMKNIFREFPQGTVHLMGVNSSNTPDDTFLALKIEEHYFVGNDNGLWGLISDEEAGVAININSLKPIESPFPAKDILAPAAAKLASNTSIQDLGKPVQEYNQMLARRPKATKQQITGHVIHVDHFGNLITNIPDTDFNILSKGKKFKIKFGRETMIKIHGGYRTVDNGDCFLLFNSMGLLEIGINNGNASQLLGLEYDSPVIINFED
jgi:S-adenosylmethionine hydrolase